MTTLPNAALPDPPPAAAPAWIADGGRGRPVVPVAWVTWGFVAVNVAVWVVMVACGVDWLRPNAEVMLHWGATYGPLALDEQWWRFFTATVIHIGVVHLASNVYGFAVLGPAVERSFGRGVMVVVVIAGGIVGSLAQTWWSPLSAGAGASGGLAAVFGTTVATVALRWQVMPPEYRASVLRWLAQIFLLNAALSWSVAGIGTAAHIGGLATGAILGALALRPGTDNRTPSPRRVALVTGVAVAVIIAGWWIVGREYRGLLRQRTTIEQAFASIDHDVAAIETAGPQAARIDTVQAIVAQLTTLNDQLETWRDQHTSPWLVIMRTELSQHDLERFFDLRDRVYVLQRAAGLAGPPQPSPQPQPQMPPPMLRPPQR